MLQKWYIQLPLVFKYLMEYVKRCQYKCNQNPPADPDMLKKNF